MIPWLIAVYCVGHDYHNGQWCPWYARMCMAGELLLRWYQIRDPFEWMAAPYIRDDYQQRATAHYHRLVAHHRLAKDSMGCPFVMS